MKQINSVISKFSKNCKKTSKIAGFISQTRDFIHHSKLIHFYFLTKYNTIIIIYSLDTITFSLKTWNYLFKFKYISRIVKICIWLYETEAYIFFFFTLDNLIFKIHSTFFSFPNILFIDNFCTRVVLQQPICPITKILQENFPS